MALSSGTRLGPYQIAEPLGAGGMGEVYRARDTRLGRDVAIKVLPEAFTIDAARLARFEREAKVLASLNHPNIAQIFGIEESGSVRALVMEYVEGEDLSARVAHGPVPADEVLPIARQIADALEAAHDSGIVHRDLKPANIRIRPDGMVKVLDFGLAKAVDPQQATGVDLSHSPTMTAHATEMGVILGTAAYMSPEQARGRAVDKRADIWAFGVILFELISGKRLFEGDTASDTLAAVLRQEIDWKGLPAATPPVLVRMLHRCLEREPRRRLRDIGEARFELSETSLAPDVSPASAPRARSPWLIIVPLAAITMGALALTVWVWLRASSGRMEAPTHLSIALPDGQALLSGPAISRDGRRVAFVSSDGVGRPLLHARALDESDSRSLAGTEEADQPFFSPDGQWIAYYAQNRLWKVRFEGGAPQPLATSTSHAGGTWTDEGPIIYKKSWNGGLDSVSENGDDARAFLSIDGSDDYAYTWPCALPGRHEILFQKWGKVFGTVLLDTRTMKRRTVVPNWWRRLAWLPDGTVLSSDNGEELMATRLPSDGAVSRNPAVVLKGFDAGTLVGDLRLDVSQSGMLAYVRANRGQRWLSLVDSSGHATRVPVSEGEYSAVRISPDGRHAVVQEGGTLKLVDLERGAMSPLAPQLLNHPGARASARWSLDGRSIAFASNHEGNWDIYSISASGAGDLAAVLRMPLDQHPESFAPDGTLLFQTTGPQTGSDLWILPPGGTARPWLATEAEETEGQFSPDGRLVAYTSTASGRPEVYVQSGEHTADRVQVSITGGDRPKWGPHGDVVYFRAGNVMMSGKVHTNGGMSASVPVKLFDGGWSLAQWYGYDLAPDGRFLMIEQPRDAVPDRIDLVLNWDRTLALK